MTVVSLRLGSVTLSNRVASICVMDRGSYPEGTLSYKTVGDTRRLA